MSIKNGGLDQYGAERFDRLVFATIRKNVEIKGLMSVEGISIQFTNSQTHLHRLNHAFILSQTLQIFPSILSRFYSKQNTHNNSITAITHQSARASLSTSAVTFTIM